MKKYSIATLNKKNITDFSKERNLLLKKTKTKWIFFKDTDEIITKKLKKEIINISEIKEPPHKGYYVKRKILFLGQSAGYDKVLRLGQINSGIWKRKVHEFWDIKNPGELDGVLIHNTSKNLHTYLSKINRYSNIHSEENKREGKKSGFFKITVFPILKFLDSILRGRGLVMSIYISLHSFLAWSKQWQNSQK